MQEILTGQTLGQYQLKELLGVGGMGAVYKGYQRTLRREVAVKVLPAAMAMQAGYNERFEREAHTAALLEHAHIVPIYDYGTERGLSYVVMRLLTGGSLAERIDYSNRTDRGLPALSEVITITTHLSSALDYAHSKGVIHRDIKDRNIMFDDQGTVFLVDFGIAKLISLTGTVTQMNSQALVGTPWYMAPEQWRGDLLTSAVDQYALAMTVYLMLTGKMPYVVENEVLFQLMNKHLHEDPIPINTWRADLPYSINHVLLKAMDKDPTRRFPKLSEFATALDQAARTKPIQMQTSGFFTTPLPPKTLPPFPQPGSRPSMAAVMTSRLQVPLWAIVAIILLVIAVTAGILLASNGAIFGAAVPPTEVVLLPSPTTEAPTATNQPTATSEPPTVIPTQTPFVIVQVVSPTLTDEPTVTPLPTETPTDMPTETPVPTDTAVPTDMPVLPTFTPVPTETATFTATATETPVPSATPTLSPIPPTSTRVPSATPTSTATFTPTPTSTDTPVPPTFTSTATFTHTPTDTATYTHTPTDTATPTATFTHTPTDTATPTATLTLTPTRTPAPPRDCQWADFNENGRVDIFDVALLAQAFDTQTGDELYDARFDFDGNGRIVFLDFQRVTIQFDQVCASGE